MRSGPAFPASTACSRGCATHRAALLRVLERPEVPLHTNLSEGHLRDYVKKRKISGSTRSELGRQARDTFASLKKTCRELGVNFWAYLQDRVRGVGQDPPLGGADPPEGGGDGGQEGRGRAAGVGGWRRGGVNAEAIDGRFVQRHPCAAHPGEAAARGY